MNQRTKVGLSPYALYGREEWAGLRADTPMSLSEAELENLSGLTEKISTEEVVEIYLPLSRLLNFYVEAAQRLHGATEGFLRKSVERGKLAACRAAPDGHSGCIDPVLRGVLFEVAQRRAALNSGSGA